MSKEIVIKRNKYGMNLILDHEMPFPELLQIIADKFKETGNFFKDARMAVSFEGRELTAEEEQQIVDVITQNTDLKIACIMDNDPILEENMRLRLDACDNRTSSDYRRPEELNPQTSAVYTDPPADTAVSYSELPEVAADFYRGNLRSGQVLESSSSITLIGDVNPGAKIISQGNIVILGSLKGNAFAGAAGDSSCFIFALEMRPIQLQIGDLIAKSPDKEKKTRTSRRKNAVIPSSYTPQIATAKEGTIGIEPVTKECLGSIYK